jgi:hypothetical protein
MLFLGQNKNSEGSKKTPESVEKWRHSISSIELGLVGFLVAAAYLHFKHQSIIRVKIKLA